MIKKATGDGTAFARKEPYNYEGIDYEADIKDGDIVTILNAGVTEAGQWGEQTNFKIKTRNGEKKMSFNQSSINVLIDELGEESESWIDKEAKVLLKKTVIAGKKVVVAYFVTDKYSLDEYGEVIKEEEEDVNIDEI